MKTDFTVENKALKYLSLATMITLIALSVAWFKERILFPDSAELTFYLVNGNHFFITYTRFIDYLTQLLPFIGLCFHSSIKTIMLLHSVNYILFYTAIFAVVFFKFKDFKAAFSITLLPLLFGNWTFFYHTEFNQSLALDVFFISYCFYFSKQNLAINVFTILFLAALITTIIFSHPLAVIPFVFCCAYLFLKFFEAKKSTLLKLISASFIYAIIVFFVWKIFFITAYDANNSKKIDTLIQSPFGFFSSNLMQSFFHNIFSHSFVFGAIFILSIAFFIFKKRYVMLLWWLISSVSYFVLITSSYPDNTYNCYFEHFFQPLNLLLIIVMFYEIIPAIKINFFVPVLLLLILCFRFSKIYFFKQETTATIDWYKIQIATTNNAGYQKGIVLNNNFNPKVDVAIWATPTISLLLSSCENPSRPTTLAILWADDKTKELQADNSLFFADFGKIAQSFLNKKYFDVGGKPYWQIPK